MTDDEILGSVSAEGFKLEERTCRGQWVYGWRIGDDARFPCFLTRREALSWMGDRLTRAAVSAGDNRT
jgi:hypothetical protein